METLITHRFVRILYALVIWKLSWHEIKGKNLIVYVVYWIFSKI